jgi:serine/threonine protein kinase
MYGSNFFADEGLSVEEVEIDNSKMRKKIKDRRQKFKDKFEQKYNNDSYTLDKVVDDVTPDVNTYTTSAATSTSNLSSEVTSVVSNNNNNNTALTPINNDNICIIKSTFKNATIKFDKKEPVKMIKYTESKQNKTLNISEIETEIHIQLLQQIGNGSYGTIYKALDKQSNKIIAVKHIINEKSGLECLLEASIMKGIIHPYLNSAIDIHSTSNSLNIIQDIADKDMNDYCKPQTSDGKKFTRKPLPTETLKLWSWQLAQAVQCLHNEGIIHGDIKASNVLIFGKKIKLCDFTLSMIHIPGQTYNVPTGTSSHRPPEIWMHKDWDESSDIWSLGCTFYEMANSKFLFPVQETVSGEPIAHRYLNCIYDFCRSNKQSVPYSQHNVKYIEPRAFDVLEGGLFYDLMDKMLKLNPKERINIKEVLHHPYFKKFERTVKYLSILNKPIIKHTDIEQLKYADNFYEKYTAHKITLQIAKNIYRSVGTLEKYSTDLILLCSLLIAGKINQNQRYKTPVGVNDLLLQCERDICYKLNFRLHNKLDE